MLGGDAMSFELNLKTPFLIAGPCALESQDNCARIAAVLKELSTELQLPVVFKGSYWKANRTREESFHGLGLERGLELLRWVQREFDLQVTSDVHELCEVDQAAQVLDIIQIPALLCKNTNLLHAVAETGKPVNLKKGHFVTAQDMLCSLEKVVGRGSSPVLVTERGNLFGYGEIVVDFRSIRTLKTFGCPVIFDATHSVRITSRRSDDPAGGSPADIPMLCRCAAAAGVDGLFIETHPSPEIALCDSVVSYPLHSLKALVRNFVELRLFQSIPA
jgi:2-dehydro-3-deoxyphosphooctonate aldolase (KDO 8-P synthase)